MSYKSLINKILFFSILLLFVPVLVSAEPQKQAQYYEDNPETCDRVECPGKCVCSFGLDIVTAGGGKRYHYDLVFYKTHKMLKLFDTRESDSDSFSGADSAYYVDVNIDSVTCQLYKERLKERDLINGGYTKGPNFYQETSYGTWIEKTDPLFGSCKYEALPVKLCCCRQVESGTLSGTKSCEETQGIITNRDVCIGAGPTKDLTPEELEKIGTNPYTVFAMPKEGGCKALETEKSKYTPEAQTLEITPEKLQQDAAAKLNPLGFKDLLNFIGRVTKFSFGIMGAVSMIMYIWAGFLWMTAQGNAEKTTKAKTILVWTSLGVVAILASYMLVSFVFKDILQL